MHYHFSFRFFCMASLQYLIFLGTMKNFRTNTLCYISCKSLKVNRNILLFQNTLGAYVCFFATLPPLPKLQGF